MVPSPHSGPGCFGTATIRGSLGRMVLSKYAYKKLWLSEGPEFVELFWSSGSESYKHKQRLIEQEPKAAAAYEELLPDFL